jgi:hypothetical protein
MVFVVRLDGGKSFWTTTMLAGYEWLRQNSPFWVSPVNLAIQLVIINALRTGQLVTNRSGEGRHTASSKQFLLLHGS